MLSLRVLGAAIAGATLLTATQASAAFEPIATPDAAYLGATTKLLPSAETLDGDAVLSLSDGVVAVTFGQAATKLTAGVSWASWSTAGEEDYLTTEFPVFYTGAGVHAWTFTFDRLLSTFGFEASPEGPDFPDLDDDELYNEFGEGFAQFTVTFYRGAQDVGTLTRDLFPLFETGPNLFAAGGATFDRVEVTATDEFAFGQVRYAVAVPEPATWALMIGGFGLAGAALRRRRNASVA